MINTLRVLTYEKNSEIREYCACAVVEEKSYGFYNNPEILLETLNCVVNKSKNKKIEIYVHNLNYDGILIISKLSKNFIKYQLISNKLNIYSVKIFYCNKIILIKCSYKIIPLSLRTLEKMENFKKLYFPYKFVNENNLDYIGPPPFSEFWENDDFSNFLNENRGEVYNLRNEAIAYCTNDATLSQKVLINLFKIIDKQSEKIRKVGLSSPGISHKIFFQFYNNFSIEECIKVAEEYYVRPSYFGGRVEVFGNPRKEEHVKYYDFSGMYAQCMLENYHHGVGNYKKLETTTEPGFYNITYNSNSKIPILPFHHKGGLVFPNGTNTGTFWFEEINLFKDKGGGLLKINNALTFEKFDKVFCGFVNKFTDLRKQGGYYNIFGKLMINGLYGSMAMRYNEEIQYITFSEEEFANIYKNTNVLDFYKIELCFILIIQNDYKSKNFFAKSKNMEKGLTRRNVSYAAAIASKARIRLYNAIEETILDGGRILYCDTDSIFAAYPKKDKRTKTRTFAWVDFYDDAIFVSSKTYGLKKNNKETIKIKGVDVTNMTFEKLKNNFYNLKNLILENQITLQKSQFELRQIITEKQIFVDKYEKRKFALDKIDTTPIDFTSLYG